MKTGAIKYRIGILDTHGDNGVNGTRTSALKAGLPSRGYSHPSMINRNWVGFIPSWEVLEMRALKRQIPSR
jgi:hypothetical protein